MARTLAYRGRTTGSTVRTTRTSDTPKAAAAFPLPYRHEGDHHRLVMFRQAQLGKSSAYTCNLAQFGGVR
jgi:hypothetical protein